MPASPFMCGLGRHYTNFTLNIPYFLDKKSSRVSSYVFNQMKSLLSLCQSSVWVLCHFAFCQTFCVANWHSQSCIPGQHLRTFALFVPVVGFPDVRRGTTQTLVSLMGDNICL